MKALSLFAFLIAVAALALGGLAYKAQTDKSDDGQLAALSAKVEGIANRQDSSGRIAELGGKLDALSKRLDVLAAEQEALKHQIPEMAAQPAPPAIPITPPQAMDEARVRQLVQEEIRTQADRAAGGRGNRQQEDPKTALVQRVGLSEEKADKVVGLMSQMSDGARDIWRENRGGERDKNVQLMNELQQKTEQEIAGLLTPEELEKYKAWSAQQGRRGQGRGGRDNNAPNTPQPQGDNPAPPAEVF